MKVWSLSPDRCFDPNLEQRLLARELYAAVKDLPLICPHGHVEPLLLADPQARFGSPTELFIIPDHYIIRMLYSQGVTLEQLGINSHNGTSAERDHRRIWQCFAEHFHLFRSTPSGLWLTDELINVFGVSEKLDGVSAQRIYDHLEQQLAKPAFTPRALFARFNIEVLCTTDPATDTLALHKCMQAEGLNIRPTFRPDAVVNLHTPNWSTYIEQLGVVAGEDIVNYQHFLRALEQRRMAFKQMGAYATDHSALVPYSERLSDYDAEAIFCRALRGEASAADAMRFTGHMLIESARMSAEDGLVMQLHIGSSRNHNAALFARFGPDKGADIPIATEWTRSLHTLLNSYGNDPRFRIILFTLDESCYSRELAPLAGHYPAVYVGPPWWFYDSVNGMERYFDAVIEIAGLYNTTGFNDDTRAFASIPARHDVWRRVTCNWLARQVVRGLLDDEDAHAVAYDVAYGFAKRAYRMEQPLTMPQLASYKRALLPT